MTDGSDIPLLKCPFERSSSFIEWPKSKYTTYRQRFLEEGFQYAGNGTNLVCFSCGLKTSPDNWSMGEDPVEAHKRLAINCEYINDISKYTNKKWYTKDTTSSKEYIENILCTNPQTQEIKRLGNTNNGFEVNIAPLVPDPRATEEINRHFKERMKCIRCKTNDICILFVNCRHRLTCTTCAEKIEFCPHCDKKIKKRLQNFLS